MHFVTALLCVLMLTAYAPAQSRYTPPVTAPVRLIPPSDFVASFPSAAAAHAKISPRMGVILVAYYRHKLLMRLPNVEEFLQLVVKHGDPVCDYVINNIAMFENDAARWAVFAADPFPYLPGDFKPYPASSPKAVTNPLAASVYYGSPELPPSPKSTLTTIRLLPWWLWCGGAATLWLGVKFYRKRTRSPNA